jgi:NAD(P)H-nitrite reductase large subunit
MEKIVIIGNGISGITTARYIRKNSDAQITIISSESKYFFSRTALMYVFMGQMRFEHTMPYEKEFYAKNRLDLVFDRVESIDFESQSLALKKGDFIQYDKLILALGSIPRELNISGQNKENVQSLYSKQDLDSLEEKRKSLKKAVVIGGGLIGVELVEMLHYEGIEVDFIIRESAFWANVLSKEERAFIGKHIESKGIRMHLNEEVKEISGTDKVAGLITKSGKKLDCDFIGITAGVIPNVKFVTDTKLDTNQGILIERNFETNIPNVFAIGDCAEFRNPLENRSSIESIWYTGKIMGQILGENLGKKENNEYKPGPWFNSAKFFDIEYQNYGFVNAEIAENQKEFIWQKGLKLIRIVFDKNTDEFIGINSFGIRMRHEVFDHWLKNKVGVEEVMTNLKTANFDPEFQKSFENDIVSKFNKDFSRTVQIKKKKWYQNMIRS